MKSSFLALVFACVVTSAYAYTYPRPAEAASAAAATSAAAPAARPCDPLNLLPGCSPANKFGTALSQPFQDLATFLNSDIAAAAALATAIPSLQDTNGAACWTMLESAGAVFKAHPIPLSFHGATDLEALRLLAMEADAICTNTACTQVFTDMSNIALAVSPAPLSIPSLTAICAKVPAIGGATALPNQGQLVVPSAPVAK